MFVILCMSRDTPSENICLWPLPIVCSAFKICDRVQESDVWHHRVCNICFPQTTLQWFGKRADKFHLDVILTDNTNHSGKETNIAMSFWKEKKNRHRVTAD